MPFSFIWYNLFQVSLFVEGVLDKREQIFAQIHNHILENKSPSCCYIVGFNGVDTSGKSIMAEAFDSFLNAKGHKTQLIHIDDFHNKSDIRYQGDNKIDSYFYYAFDLSRLKNELLSPPKIGSVINKELLLLDLDTDKFTNKKKYDIDNDTIVIIEGVLLFREPIVDFIDTRIFIDITFDAVIKRAMQRDVPKYGEEFLQKYIDKYIPIQKIYLNKFSPKENSHFVIDNNDYLNPVIKNNI